MRVMYGFIDNYGVTLIIFTVLIRIVSFPLQINQQKTMAKMSVFQPMMTEIQNKYKNNKDKQQEELMKLQQEYGYNPMSGCLPMLLNMVVLFGVIEVVYRPVQYILGIPTEVINAACEALGINAANTVTAQTSLIAAIHGGATTSALSAEQLGLIQGFNTGLLGMDMCAVPGFTPSLLMIFPIVAAVTMFGSMFLTQKLSGTASQMQGSMKIMMYGMNLMFVYFCFTAPVGFSLYYGTSNICMMLQSVLCYTIYSPEKFKKQYAEELAAKKAAKKQQKTIVVEEKGQIVEKKVNQRELEKLRLERARQLDAEKYAGERTTPLSDAEREELAAADKGRKKK